MEQNLPQRVSTHINEKESFDILSTLLPKEWIVRELTERDYGIDLYIEIVKKDGLVTGDLLALQVKSTKITKFNRYDICKKSDINRSTLNYWKGLPVPVFVILIDLTTKKGYWCNVKNEDRKGKHSSGSSSISVSFDKKCDLSHGGIALFYSEYHKEKSWVQVENAIEKSLMAYNTLGPLVLMCIRKFWDESSRNSVCSTTIQYLLIEHYSYYETLSSYFDSNRNKVKPLSDWYEFNIQACKSINRRPSVNFLMTTIKEMIDYFISDYRGAIIESYKYVTNSHKHYFFERKPYLCVHLENRPHTFIIDDWFSRYFFDEYIHETEEPEKLFFKDFGDFDFILDEIGYS